MEAARWWAGVRPPDPSRFEVDEDILQAMQEYGAPPDEIAQARAAMVDRLQAHEAQQTFAVHADNWLSVQAFVAVQTQWVYAGMNGQRCAMAYDCVLAWVDHFVPRRDRRQVFTDLQLMERAVLAADRELISQT